MMNTRLILFTLILLGYSIDLSAQEHPYERYSFQEYSEDIPSQYSDVDELVLHEYRDVSIVVDGNKVRQFYLHHDIVRVNTDLAIEKNNKLYVRSSESFEILRNECRVLQPDGKVIPLSKSDIIEEVDPQSGKHFQYFAVQGLVKGSRIEHIMLREEMPYFQGARYFFGSSRPVIKSTFKLTYPEHLEMYYRSYNGLPEAVFVQDTLSGDYSLTVVDTMLSPIYDEEKLSNFREHAKSFRYKLYKNIAQGTQNYYNYEDFSNNVQKILEVDLSKSDKKAIAEMLEGIQKEKPSLSFIRSIEDFIKTNLAYNADYEDNKSIADLYKSKQGTQIDFMKLYKALFDKLEINHEFVFTSDRQEAPFDTEFETTNNFNDVLIYFPEIDSYLDVEAAWLRMPAIQNNLTATAGMKMTNTKLEGVTMMSIEPTYIEPIDMYRNTDTMNISLDMSDGFDEPLLKTKIVFGINAGMQLRMFKDVVPEDDYEEFLKELAQSYSFEMDDFDVDVKNNGLGTLDDGNFAMHIKGNSDALVRKAGKKYLIDIGKVIGPQSELYHEKERTLPVEMTQARRYLRTIVLKIPEGYKILNPEDVESDVRCESDENTEAVFTTSYTLEDDMLEIRNEEYYRKIHYSLDEYDTFREVYNTAADFNKITLVLEPK